MKRLKSTLIVLSLLVSGSVFAQRYSSSDNYIFTHLGAGLSVGTDGIGIELAAPITPYVGLRAGTSFFPKIKVNRDDIDYTRNKVDGKGRVEGTFKKVEGKALVDIYPLGNKFSVHLTGGLFFGNSDLATASFFEDPKAPIGGGIAKKINGEQWNVRANNGAIDLRLTTNKVKPYIGIGVGRMVPKPNKRVGVAMDLGVQFHGTPKIEGYASATTMSGTRYKWVELEPDDFDFGKGFRDDAEDALDIIHKVKVWPVLNVRITGRIF